MSAIDVSESQPAVPSEPRAARRQGSQLYFASALFGQVAALLRYVTLARMLGPEQLGVAAILVVTGSFFDMIADTGSDRFLIQDRDGDTVELQRLVHLVYVGRGLAIAAALVLFAGPIAAFYHLPRLAMGLVWLAASPLIGGFMHLDLRRVQRRLDFRPEALGVIIGEGASLLATGVAAWLTRDFTAILYGLIVRSLALVVVSHFTAERQYKLGWSSFHGPRLSRFSAPMMMSGLMLFIGAQGDRVLVGNQLGAKALGEYSAVILLIFYPAAMLLKYVHVMYMPLISSGRDDPAQRDRMGDKLGGETLILAVGMATGFAILTPFVLPYLYGQRFAQPALLVGMIGVLQTTRFMILWPTTVALSMARSVTVFLSNLSRMLVFPFAFLGLRLIGGLIGVVGGFCLGEAVSILVSLMLMNRDIGRPVLTGAHRLALFLGAGALIIAWNLALGRASAPIYLGLLAVTALLAATLAKTEATALLEAFEIARNWCRKFARRLAPVG